MGARGPTLLEDFILREKITHFDHERIPERIVHARGTGAHGHFELTHSLAAYTTAKVLTELGVKTPVSSRISTVAGGSGSSDTPRDVRGFAIKFPHLVHAVKMEPDRGFPQAASAHDTFWDFISLTPEAMHMVMWIMSDRTLPRSLRMIEGFGIHSFRLVNAAGESTFVKFHWRPKLGLQSTLWDEACKIAGGDPDFHRRELFEALSAGVTAEWEFSEFSVQLFTQEMAETFPFDHLDATKLIPEELVPLTVIGRLVPDRWPDNVFAETGFTPLRPVADQRTERENRRPQGGRRDAGRRLHTGRRRPTRRHAVGDVRCRWRGAVRSRRQDTVGGGGGRGFCSGCLRPPSRPLRSTRADNCCCRPAVCNPAQALWRSRRLPSFWMRQKRGNGPASAGCAAWPERAAGCPGRTPDG